MIERALAAQLSGLLERPGRPGLLRRSLSTVWGLVANPVREVSLPPGARVVGVGGPTLGGSYKTPFVLALAASLAERGRTVAVAAHGYRAGIRAPRRVLPLDDARDVGDDALFLARELHELGIPVFVGKRWTATVVLAASYGGIVLVDGLLQASPKRLDWSVLVLDGSRPWGSDRCPPAGDRRASRAALLAASDDTAEIVDRSASPPVDLGDSEGPVLSSSRRSTFRVSSDIVGIRGARSETLSFDAVARVRVGLLAAVARPERIVASLTSRGITPIEIRVFGDHRALPERPWSLRREAAVDVWLTTGKCATKLGSHYEGKPVCRLTHRLVLPRELVDRVAGARRSARD